MRAAEHGHYEIAVMLADHGAALNTQDLNGESPLMMAASWGYSEIVQALVCRGAVRDLSNKQGWMASMFAKDFGHAEVAKLLDECGDASTGLGLVDEYPQPPKAALAAQP